MSLVDLLDRDRRGPRPPWDAPAPPEYQPHDLGWYVARKLGCLDEYEAHQGKPVTVIDADTLEPV